MIDLKKAREYLDAISNEWKIGKCRNCECFQGALLQLEMDFPELKDEIEKLLTKQFHKCLGCEPCPPAALWIEYIKEKNKAR